MTRPTPQSRLLYALGAGAVIAAVGSQVARAHLPTIVVAVEGLLFGVGTIYAALVVRREADLLTAPALVGRALTVINITLAVSILMVAAPYLPDPVPLAFAVLLTTILATVLSGSERAAGPRPLVVTGLLVVAISLVWLRAGGGSTAHPPAELLTWAGMLAGLGILLEVHWRHGRMKLDARMTHLETLSAVAQRLGQATELDDVASGALEAFRRAYPQLGYGGILMWNPKTEVLESLRVSLGPDGVTVTPPSPSGALAIRPGEGVAGEAFATGNIVCRATAAQASRDAASRRTTTNAEIDKLVGVVRSAIAVPLRSGKGELIGVVSLGSNTAEHEWSAHDLLSIEAIANQAGVAIERGQMYEQQKVQASTDPLTGLPNRREFERVLSGPGVPGVFTILAIDLDNLKLVNDEYGHEAGDAVLRLCGSALRAGLRTDDILARVGGDEFAALLPATGPETAMEVAERLTHSMQGVAVPYGSARISAGCASGSTWSQVRRVWSEADQALYQAKTRGRNRVELVLSPAPVQLARRWADSLPAMLARREMGVAYQPVVSLDDNRVVGYEALARPLVADHGPGVEGMFSAAVRMGFGRDLDWLCRRAAIQDAHQLPLDALLFVNVGVTALLDPLHDVDQMMLLCRWGGRSPETVVLEITEREAVHDRDRFREVLLSYRAAGFRFAMDDVGEGHSTLEMLAAGSPEFIKIATSLTRAASSPGPNAAIRALTTFASHSGAAVIAEGMESARDVEVMLSLGVELGQGYHLGVPAAAAVPSGTQAAEATEPALV